jgi:hypothetical protein
MCVSHAHNTCNKANDRNTVISTENNSRFWIKRHDFETNITLKEISIGTITVGTMRKTKSSNLPYFKENVHALCQ